MQRIEQLLKFSHVFSKPCTTGLLHDPKPSKTLYLHVSNTCTTLCFRYTAVHGYEKHEKTSTDACHRQIEMKENSFQARVENKQRNMSEYFTCSTSAALNSIRCCTLHGTFI